MSSEGYVQVAPNSTGAKVRNIQVEMYVPDLTNLTANSVTPVNVLQQVVSIADENGDIISKFIDHDFQQQVIELLTDIRNSLAILAKESEPNA